MSADEGEERAARKNLSGEKGEGSIDQKAILSEIQIQDESGSDEYSEDNFVEEKVATPIIGPASVPPTMINNNHSKSLSQTNEENSQAIPNQNGGLKPTSISSKFVMGSKPNFLAKKRKF